LIYDKGAKEATRLIILSSELGISNDEPTQILCDNMSAFKIVNNSIFHASTKHIKTHYPFIKEKVLRREIDWAHILLNEQRTYILTKPLG
jgi:hypothetical protein